MDKRIHRVCQHKISRSGIEAVSLRSNHVFPRHAHDHFGIGLIALGAQTSWSGIGQVEAATGDVIMVNPGEIHDGRPVGGAMREWHMLYADPVIVAGEFVEEGEIAVARPTARDATLSALFVQLFAKLTAALPDDLAIEEDLVRTLVYVSRRHGMHGAKPLGPAPAVAKARQRLDMAPQAGVSLAELAALSGVSRFELLRGFARDLGVTPHAYLTQHRVRHARRLLAGGMSPVEAACEAGFADQSHMTRAFVRQFGVTPGRLKAALA